MALALWLSTLEIRGNFSVVPPLYLEAHPLSYVSILSLASAWSLPPYLKFSPCLLLLSGWVKCTERDGYCQLGGPTATEFVRRYGHAPIEEEEGRRDGLSA